ncbi:MAG TPA: outer membrane protein assembly factor BamE [Candidatus Methylacidiphilales bacterium]|jgi:outer membrane protein assembly factor BamE (lipoprotein component of BamABCDE complex)|nr:outer membrane protein assembly factor BamE [Candidatus Methylacidiphilales bacterium]
MKTLRTLLLFTAVVALAACSKLTQDNLEKVHNGMTSDEVKAILGEPTSSSSGSFLGQTGTEYVYHTDKSDVKIDFVNDKVIATSGSFQ